MLQSRYINGTALDDRIIRTDWDSGFEEGRQYGLGKSGGQVREKTNSYHKPKSKHIYSPFALSIFLISIYLITECISPAILWQTTIIGYISMG